jgi:creatinine amidohydrolase
MMTPSKLLLASYLSLISLSMSAQHLEGTAAATRYNNSVPPEDLSVPRPIGTRDTVFIEEMTGMEVRDALKAGKTSIIIATGGIEQNGPYVALGKHNFVLHQDCEAIARLLGNALVAPIVPFVPEGHHSPKTHHMRYPGTISITEETFEQLLIEIATSFKIHGFQQILLLGDSGDNQYGMDHVAKKLSAQWEDHPTTIRYIAEYYAPAVITEWLRKHGINEVDEGLHDRFRYEAQIATLDPRHIRLSHRRKVGLTSINGVSILPFEKTKAIGWQLIEFQDSRTVAAIQNQKNSPSTTSPAQ